MPSKGYVKGNRIKCLTNRAEIVLTNGDIAIIDLNLVEKIRGYTWGIADKKKPYPMTAKYDQGKIKRTYLHHFILPTMSGMHVDHINQNIRDNRRKNLRYVTSQVNCRNSKRPGVSLDSNNGKWRARITIEKGRTISLGSFVDKGDAIKARQAGEAKYFGEIARRK